MPDDRPILPEGLTPRLLSKRQAAAYCGVSEDLFTQRIANVVVPMKLGGRVLWDRRAIDRWLDIESGLPVEGTTGINWSERL